MKDDEELEMAVVMKGQVFLVLFQRKEPVELFLTVRDVTGD